MSKQQFSQVYERLDVTNEIVGESFYQPCSRVVELRARAFVEDLNEKTGKTGSSRVKDAIQIPLPRRSDEGTATTARTPPP